MEVIDQADTKLAGGVEADTKTVVIILKTTSRRLAAALHALGAGPVPLVLDACPLEPGLH